MCGIRLQERARPICPLRTQLADRTAATRRFRPLRQQKSWRGEQPQSRRREA